MDIYIIDEIYIIYRINNYHNYLNITIITLNILLLYLNIIYHPIYKKFYIFNLYSIIRYNILN